MLDISSDAGPTGRPMGCPPMGCLWVWECEKLTTTPLLKSYLLLLQLPKSKPWFLHRTELNRNRGFRRPNGWFSFKQVSSASRQHDYRWLATLYTEIQGTLPTESGMWEAGCATTKMVGPKAALDIFPGTMLSSWRRVISVSGNKNVAGRQSSAVANLSYVINSPVRICMSGKERWYCVMLVQCIARHLLPGLVQNGF